MIDRSELRSLRDRLEESRRILNTTALPPRAVEAKEILESAIQQANHMLSRPTAAELAAKGRAKISIKKG